MPNITLTPKSSRLHRVAHDPATNRLQVTFKDKSGQPGKTYEYENFTADHWDALHKAESQGSFIIRNVVQKKDAHPFRMLDPQNDEVWS